MRSLLVLALVLFLPFTALANDYQGNCSIIFQGSSTLHDFEGSASCESFTVSENADVMTFPELNVAVSGMDTDNTKRDKKMREMFMAEIYPLITGSAEAVVIKDIRKTLKESSDDTAEFAFKLNIRETEKPVIATLQNIVEAGSTITADLFFSLSLADYQLKPPSVLGFIKVSDNVDVTVSFTMDAQ